MNILPIQLISEIDQPIFGVNAFNLAKLKRIGFPVAEGISVEAPEIVLQTIFKHFSSFEKEVFEQRLNVVKSEVGKIPLPEELEKELGKQKSFYFNGQVFHKKDLLWLCMLGTWLNEIGARLYREGFSGNISSNLKTQNIFFLKDIDLQITAYLDPDSREVVIKSGDKITPVLLKQIDSLVSEGNKKLFFPQVYTFIGQNSELLLVELLPFTQTLTASTEKPVVISQDEQKIITKSAIKVFLNLSSASAGENIIDGALVDGESILEFDDAALKLSEIAVSLGTKPVIYKLPDILGDEIRGTLRLIHQKSLLDLSANIFLFLRDKKRHFNVDVAVPFVRSADEFSHLQSELLTRGISREGGINIWVEFAVPENLINIEDYLKHGFDGVILDIDSLQKFLGGYELSEGEYYKKQVNSLLKFIKPVFKTLHQAKIPVLIKGSLAVFPDVLESLIEDGIWAVVSNPGPDSNSLSEHLNWVEKRVILKRSA